MPTAGFDEDWSERESFSASISAGSARIWYLPDDEVGEGKLLREHFRSQESIRLTVRYHVSERESFSASFSAKDGVSSRVDFLVSERESFSASFSARDSTRTGRRGKLLRELFRDAARWAISTPSTTGSEKESFSASFSARARASLAPRSRAGRRRKASPRAFPLLRRDVGLDPDRAVGEGKLLRELFRSPCRAATLPLRSSRRRKASPRAFPPGIEVSNHFKFIASEKESFSASFSARRTRPVPGLRSLSAMGSFSASFSAAQHIGWR